MSSGRAGAGVFVAALLLAGSATAVRAAITDSWSRSWLVRGKPDVHVIAHDAAVTVHGWDTDSVEVRVATTRWKLGAGGVRVEPRWNGNRLDLEISHGVPLVGLGSQPRSLKLEIRVPRQSAVEVRTGEETKAPSKIVPAGADPRAGDIAIEDVTGDVDLNAGAGGISGSGLKGRLKARTTSGTIRVDGEFCGVSRRCSHPGSKPTEGWQVVKTTVRTTAVVVPQPPR